MSKDNSEDQLKNISNKLSLLIRLLIRQDSNLSKLTAKETITMVNNMGFPSEEISVMFDIPIKTVRNILPKLAKKNEKS